MIDSHKEAFQELREWCKKHGAVIRTSHTNAGMVCIKIDDGNFRSYFVGQFDKSRGSVIIEERQSID